MINGSPHVGGCSASGLQIMEDILNKQSIETIRINVPADCPSCMACGYCHSHEGCVRKDKVNETYELLDECAGLVVASPVYYGGPSGSLLAFLDRLFYSYPHKDSLNMKAAAVFSNSRRAGNLTSNDVITRFFSISGMAVITSSYWNDPHGNSVDEQLQDEEGIQTLSNLAYNLAWYLKAYELAEKNGLEKPVLKKEVYTNFVR